MDREGIDPRSLQGTGSHKWVFNTRNAVHSSPVIGPDGTVYFGSSDGSVYAVYGTAPPADTPWPMFRHDPRHLGRSSTSQPAVAYVQDKQ